MKTGKQERKKERNQYGNMEVLTYPREPAGAADSVDDQKMAEELGGRVRKRRPAARPDKEAALVRCCS
jgi:hypothetical protein